MLNCIYICAIFICIVFHCLCKQEAQVLQRIAELRRNGMWSARQLPKLVELSRCRAHWDYVIDEMQWLAVDFAQERRWKMAAAKQVLRPFLT